MAERSGAHHGAQTAGQGSGHAPGQYPNRTPDQIADALIEGASRASATVGVAVGAWAVLPFVPAAGVEIATETLSVVGIEIKLVAELHEVYGMRAPGNVIERMTAYVGAWPSAAASASLPAVWSWRPARRSPGNCSAVWPPGPAGARSRSHRCSPAPWPAA